MYITKAVREQIEKINNYVEQWNDTKEFKQFIEDQKIYVGLMDKKECLCTKCKHKFNTKLKINEYDICPKCNQKILLKRTTNYSNKDYVMYLIPYKNDEYIVRNYEIYSYMNYKKEMCHIITEYARQAVTGYLAEGFIINNMRRNTSGYFYISYQEKTRYWKPEYYIMICGKCFVDEGTLRHRYYNPKAILDNAEVNIREIIDGVTRNDYRLELLTKAKLYNLASDYQQFQTKGKFEDIFGVDKSYLEFMQQNNITYKELITLQLVKIKDHNLIQYLSELHDLKELLEYCKPYDLYNYKLKDTWLYLDYIKFCKKLRYNLKDKSVLYPKNLKSKHDELQNLIKINKSKQTAKKIKARYNKIKKNIYENKKFIIYPTKSVEEMINESAQQNNCVKTYADRVAKGQCDIYFMRLVNELEKSLVTVEVRKNKVVQQRTKNNMDTTPEQKRFLKKWERDILCKIN